MKRSEATFRHGRSSSFYPASRSAAAFLKNKKRFYTELNNVFLKKRKSDVSQQGDSDRPPGQRPGNALYDKWRSGDQRHAGDFRKLEGQERRETGKNRVA